MQFEPRSLSPLSWRKVSSRLGAFALAASLAASLPGAATAATVTYEVDRAHSSVIFKVRHLISYTTGKFGDFQGKIEIDPEKRDSVTVSGSIEVASIDTDEPDRDEHLRGEDFFDAAKYPQITFSASTLSWDNAEKTKGKLTGDLSMHGVTRPVVIDVEWFGTATDPWGNKKAAFRGATTLNRKDYGIVWNKALDSGGVLIGEEVSIEINVEAGIPQAK